MINYAFQRILNLLFNSIVIFMIKRNLFKLLIHMVIHDEQRHDKTSLIKSDNSINCTSNDTIPDKIQQLEQSNINEIEGQSIDLSLTTMIITYESNKSLCD